MTKPEQLSTFEEWLKAHKGLLFKITRAYAQTPMDQDDLFQEIVIQVWRSVPAFRQESAVTTWLYRIALNTAIKWSSREKSHSRSETLDDAHHVLHEKPEVDERLTWLYEEISRMDEIDRSITLLLLDGFSYKEMAQILGITESNVGVKINRVKKLLIAKSKQHGNHGI